MKWEFYKNLWLYLDGFKFIDFESPLKKHCDTRLWFTNYNLFI